MYSFSPSLYTSISGSVVPLYVFLHTSVFPAASTAVITNIFVPFFAVTCISISFAISSPSFGSASIFTVVLSSSSSHLYVTYASSVSSVTVIFPLLLSISINGFSVSFVPKYSLVFLLSWSFLSIALTVNTFSPFGISIDSLYSPLPFKDFSICSLSFQ